jgi:DNA-binding HxlR family transcriptional regulator
MAAMSDPHPSATVFSLISGMMRTQTIAAFAELGVADAIAAGTTGTDALAREVGANADALRRMLRLLEADGLVRRSAPEEWHLSETGELLRDGVDGSLRHLAILFGREVYDAWSAAATSLRSGGAAFSERFGLPFFDWLQAHPESARRFDRAMSGTSSVRLLPLLERSWTAATTIVDIGGGDGSLLEALLSRFPSLEGISFDLPQVSKRAAARIAATSVADRLRAEGGDFFESVPAAADVYVLSQVLHDWGDAECVRILGACARAASPDARLLVLEQVLPDDGAASPVTFTDLNMLVLLGGRERTLAQFEQLLEAAGWQLVERRDGPRWSMLEASPAAQR